MLLYLLVSLYEFRQFLHVVIWITLPAIFVAVVVTVLLHYRRQKKAAKHDPARFFDSPAWSVKQDAQPVVLPLPGENLPDWLASSQAGNDSLLKKYEHEVRRYRENYAILEQDFRELEYKYTDLLNKAYRAGNEEHSSMIKDLQQELAGYREKDVVIGQLQEQLVKQQQLAASFERKLEQSTQLLMRICDDLSRSVGDKLVIVEQAGLVISEREAVAIPLG